MRETFRYADKLLDGYERDAAYWIQFKADGHVHALTTEGKLDRREYDRETPEVQGAWSTDKKHGKWKPSIHMKKEYARIFLEITKVRVERVQDITREDSMAEGVDWRTCGGFQTERQLRQMIKGGATVTTIDYVDGFKKLWDSIHAKRGYSWESNPYVWVLDFKQTESISTTNQKEQDNGPS